MSCAAALPQLDRGSDYESERHRFESYTPHQLNLKPPATGAFLLRRHCMDSNLGRGAGVEKTRSVLARGRARRQAGEAGADLRSRCAESYTPHQSNLKPPATGAFLLRRYPMDSNLGRGKNSLIITSKNFFSNCRLTHRGLACIIIRALRRYLSWIEGLTTNQNVIGSNPIRRTN